MSDDQAKYLDAFSNWLGTLGADAEQLSGVLREEGASEEARKAVAGGLNYLFKSLDLIPDGIDDIGYLDDAFVLRVAAEMAAGGDLGAAAPAVERLGGEAALVKEFLESSYPRLKKYVEGLKDGAARGRTVNEILGDEVKLEDFLSDVRGFNGDYDAPTFSRDPKSLVKLRAFFDAKLPK